MAVLTAHADGSYDWECEGCGGVRARYGPHRGPHRRFCKSCQNNRFYRSRRPDVQRTGSADQRRMFHRMASRRSGAAGKEPHAGA